MYGITPSAKIEAFPKAPPENMFNKPIKPSCVHELLPGLWLLAQGRILNHKQVKPYRTRKVKVLRAQNAMVSLDGRRILPQNYPLEVTILPEHIKMVIP